MDKELRFDIFTTDGKRVNLYTDMIERLNNPEDEIRKIFPGTVLFKDCPAGEKMHHTEPGGLIRHYNEMFEWMLDKNWIISHGGLEELFELVDIIQSVILHDLSKVLLYRWATPEEKEKEGLSFKFIKRERNIPFLSSEYLTMFLINYFNLNVSWDVFVAVCFAEGGWSDISKVRGSQPNKLGYFLHMADLYSSQFLGRE